MGLDFILQKIKDAIYDDDNTTYKRGDSHGLIGQVEGLFGGLLGGGGQQGGNAAPGTVNNPMSSDQDPHGDPGAQYPQSGGQQGDVQQQYPNLKSSNEDPLGDPGAQSPQGQANNTDDLRQRFPNLKSSNEDPLGDPGAQR